MWQVAFSFFKYRVVDMEETKNGNQKQEDKKEPTSAEDKTEATTEKLVDKTEVKSDDSKNSTKRSEIKKLDQKATDDAENGMKYNCCRGRLYVHIVN